MRLNKRRKTYLIILVFVIVICIFIVGSLIKFNEINKEVSAIEINTINFNNIKDGTYQGEYYIQDFVGAKVELTIENGKIKNIKLLDHKNGMGKKAEEIINIVIEKQTLEVDTISGATCSSTLILKAIENAVKE